MVETDEAFRTDNMALATVLVMQGYPYRLEKIGPYEAVWVFDDERCNEEEFDRLVERFESRSTRVEPMVFIHHFTRVRRDLFSFVPPDPNRGRSRGRSDASSVSQG